MADVVDKATRSRMMSGIRAKNTSPELKVRSLLHRAGFRFKLHQNDLPGKPDIVLPKYRVAILVHGCFWHGHKCAAFRWPETNATFWRQKIEGNVARDSKARAHLKREGWKAITLWECDIRQAIRTNKTVALVERISKKIVG